jgi:hypothetical protein
LTKINAACRRLWFCVARKPIVRGVPLRSAFPAKEVRAMQVRKDLGKVAAALAVLLVISGCETTQQTTETQAAGVTQAEFSALKAEVADLRAHLERVQQEARSASARADAAEQAAQRAAADARAAAEKADRIYVKSLQK